MLSRLQTILFTGRFARVLGSKAMQPFWGKTLKLALFGMNYGGGHSIRYSGEIWVIRRFRGLFPAEAGRLPVVFDVGANSGEYAAEIGRHFGDRVRLFCFEPSAAAFAKLGDVVGPSKNLTLLNFGLSDSAGRASLFSDSKGSTVSSLHQGRTSVADLTEVSEDCQLRPLDEFCADSGVDRVDLMKIDVEGNELHVLQGASEMLRGGHIDLIQFEFGEAQINSRTFFRQIYELLAPSHRLCRILRAGLAPLDAYNEVQEIYRTTNYLAISRSRPDLMKAFGV